MVAVVAGDIAPRDRGAVHGDLVQGVAPVGRQTDEAVRGALARELRDGRRGIWRAAGPAAHLLAPCAIQQAVGNRCARGDVATQHCPLRHTAKRLHAGRNNLAQLGSHQPELLRRRSATAHLLALLRTRVCRGC
jgi:hypothetical protein